MSYITWGDFRVILPRDWIAYEDDMTGHNVAYIIDNQVIWIDAHVPPYGDFILGGNLTFSSVTVDVNGVPTEAVHMTNGVEEYTVVCPEMITAMFLSDPIVVERFVTLDKDGPYAAPGWFFDPDKPDFPRFYIDETRDDGSVQRAWSNGTMELLNE